jgi:hypothetical protein
MGIDVWRLRETSKPKSAKASKTSETHSKRAKKILFKGDKLAEEGVIQNSSAAPVNLPPFETQETTPTKSEVPNSDSMEGTDTTDDPSIELQCLAMGSCLIVFNPDIRDSVEMAKGIGYALCMYELTSPKSVDFKWPPLLSGLSQSESNHGGWNSARRAFHSLINHQEWNTNILVTVGSNANKVTESLQHSEYTVLKLSEFPFSAHSKRELWHRIQEIL